MKYLLPMFGTSVAVVIMSSVLFANYTDIKKLEQRIELQNKTIQTISKENDKNMELMSEHDNKINTGHAKVDMLRKVIESNEQDLKDYKDENQSLKKRIEALEKSN